MRDWLKNNPDKSKEIEEKIRAAYKGKPTEEEQAQKAEEADGE